MSYSRSIQPSVSRVNSRGRASGPGVSPAISRGQGTANPSYERSVGAGRRETGAIGDELDVGTGQIDTPERRMEYRGAYSVMAPDEKKRTQIQQRDVDDVFDEEADDFGNIAETEWSRLERGRTKDGFRDGVGDAMDQRLQAGFDEGYQNSVRLSSRLGKLRGMLSALLVLHMKPANDFRIDSEDVVSSVEELITQISEFEEALSGKLKSNLQRNEEGTEVDRTQDEKESEMEAMVSKFEERVDIVLEKFSLKR